MKRLISTISILVLALIVVSAGSVFAYINEDTATLYGGPSNSGDIWGNGTWAADASTSMTWFVGFDTEKDMWHYSYTFNVAKYDVSHFIIQVSDNFDDNDLFNPSHNGPIVIGTYTIDNGNPGMPGEIYGIKFDQTSGTDLTVSFDSPREPMWGNFYAKDGSHGGAMWNSGLEDSETGKFVKVPDTVVPEPMTMLAACAILSPATLVFRRRKR